ncbi:hypothetical protein BI313_14530 [Xanthomonas vesicatoria]|nr:hypothetical protein BI313_14530 [Xanthomonas vesicatoria]
MVPISSFACTGSGAWAPLDAACREAAVERDERFGRMFGLVHKA